MIFGFSKLFFFEKKTQMNLQSFKKVVMEQKYLVQLIVVKFYLNIVPKINLIINFKFSVILFWTVVLCNKTTSVK